jgi:hypothetical protein
MASIIMNEEDVPAALKEVLENIEQDNGKKSCDLPGCGQNHDKVSIIRMAKPKSLNLMFCSWDHLDQAKKLWFSG